MTSANAHKGVNQVRQQPKGGSVTGLVNWIQCSADPHQKGTQRIAL